MSPKVVSPLDLLSTQLKADRNTDLYAPYILARLQAENIRFDEVPEADPHTFHWILPDGKEEMRVQALRKKAREYWDYHTPKQEKQLILNARNELRFHEEDLKKHKEDLLHWLRVGSGILHVEGKLGSGKSCLMKFIVENQMTKQLLRDWAHPKELCMARFFLWKPGANNQNTIQGLTRGLLYSMIKQCPNLAGEMFPQVVELGLDEAKMQTRIEFTAAEVRQAFDQLIRADAVHNNYKFCFFIDGLDEIAKDSEHDQLVKMLLDWTKSRPSGDIKICVSSRDLPVFLKMKVSSRLRLQDLTRYDIKRFILHNLDTWSGVQDLGKDFAEEISRKIFDRADGVFLWVKLVLESLNQGITNGDSAHMLRKRLEELPQDLYELFDHLLKSIERPNERRYLPSALLLFIFTMIINTDGPYFIDDNQHGELERTEYPKVCKDLGFPLTIHLDLVLGQIKNLDPPTSRGWLLGFM